jgi:hypothetical protein
MSFPTQPCFVTACKGWDEALLRHPMLQFLHKFSQLFDSNPGVEACRPYYAPGYAYAKTTGETFSGEAAVQQTHADFGLFAAWHHEPSFAMVTETDDGRGYVLAGFARTYVNLPGDGGRAVEDLQGRRWECVGDGAFRFVVVRDPETGMKFREWKVCADPMPILGVALKRGLLPVEALTEGGN